MSVENILKEFATLHNIDLKEVNKFMERYNNPKTLNGLINLPESMRKNIDYITRVDEPLKSFISDELWCERYMTKDLDDVVDSLYDRIYYLLRDENPDLDLDVVGVENLTTENEDKKEQLEKLKAVAKSLVEQKFNSVVYDW